MPGPERGGKGIDGYEKNMLLMLETVECAWNGTCLQHVEKISALFFDSMRGERLKC